MIVLYLALFPIIGLLFAIYIGNKSSTSWMFDLSVTLRSLLFGRRTNKTFFVHNHDDVCFHTSTTSPGAIGFNNNNMNINNNNNTMTNNNNNNNSLLSASTATTKQRSPGSKLKSTPIEWLPSENFSFHQSTCDQTDSIGQQRPLLILFAWLFAKERHLDKYRTLYMERGFDILTIKVNVRDFLIPQSGSQQIAAYIVKFLEERRPKYRAYIFHAFSVGAYQMGELFVLLEKEVNKQANSDTKTMLKGIIYDSALDIREAPLGLSKATTNNTFLQWGISSLMNAHLRLCYHLSTRHYICSSQAVRANRYGAPTLVFLSKDDEVANYLHQFEIIDKWRQDGVPVMAKCWDQSPHVSHFFKHPDEYRTFLDDFLKNTAKIL
ncbi:hypothetical protein RDWZM_000491 [Blomia tropicalis]|uniref:Transmembrane protein 53 n=1 Tax=Blomia tropicalis TaxID=40697 RepID=A0A9Q0RPP1_BLOTA|nr:hypothetical protein RDWZM_000491 [Blomia tropicalis]